MAALSSIVGLVANLIGVIILFRYGMPFHVPRKGQSSLLLEGIDHESLKKEACYTILGHVGLILIVVGTLFQVVGVLCS